MIVYCKSWVSEMVVCGCHYLNVDYVVSLRGGSESGRGVGWIRVGWVRVRRAVG